MRIISEKERFSNDWIYWGIWKIGTDWRSTSRNVGRRKRKIQETKLGFKILKSTRQTHNWFHLTLKRQTKTTFHLKDFEWLHRSWWRLLETKCVGDSFGSFCHQHSLSFNISVEHQQPKNVTNIEILSLQKLSPR